MLKIFVAVLLIVGLSTLIIGIYFRSYFDVLLYCSLITIAIGAIAVGLSRHPKFLTEKKDKVDTSGSVSVSEVPSQQKPILLMTVNAALYAVIAGFAITNTMRFIFDKITKNITELSQNISAASLTQIFDAINRSQNEILVSGVFLATAIPFYHGAMVFLSDKSKTVEKESAKGFALHFSILFLQSIIFLAASFSLESSKFVVMLLLSLMTVDSIWIIWAQMTKSKPPLGWLGLNLSFAAALILSIYQTWSQPIFILFVSSLIRTTIDYVVFNEMYKK